MNKRRSGGWRRFLAGAAAACLCVSGMPGMAALAEDGNDGAMGRYLETEVELPEGCFPKDVVRLDDGRLRIIAYNDIDNPMLWDSSDGGATWEQAAVLTENVGYLFDIALASDGGGAAVAIDAGKSETEPEYSYVSFDAEGTVKKTPLSDMDYWLLAFTDTNELIGVGYGIGAAVLDRDNGEVKSVLTGEAPALVAGCGSEALLVTQSDVQRYDAATGESLGRWDALSEAMFADGTSYEITNTTSVPAAFATDEEGRLYYVTQKGIFAYTPDGSVVEQVVDGSLNSLQDPSFGIMNLAVCGQCFYLVHYDGDGRTALAKYEYSADTPTVPENEITVYSLYENNDIRQIATQFQKEKPNSYVKYEIGMSGEDGVTVSDALRTLNTDILAGNGPDILVLDGMSVDTYVKQGLLVDLNPVLDEIKSGDGLLENIAYAYQREETVAAVPLKFAVPMVAGDKEKISGVEGLDSLVALANEPNVLNRANVYMLPELLYPVCAGSWKQEDNTIDQEKLQEYVQTVKSVYDGYRSNADQENLDILDMLEEEGGSRIFFTNFVEYYSEMGDLSVGLMDLLSGNADVLIGSLSGMVGYSGVSSVNGVTGNCSEKLLAMQQSGVFAPMSTLGVLNTSGSQEQALDFVRFALSEKAQTLSDYNGFPVNRNAFTSTLYEPMWEDGVGYSNYWENNVTGESYSLEYKWPTQEELDDLAAQVEELTVCADGSMVQSDVVLAETRRCMSGEISVDEAVNSIMQKINLYLAE